MYKRTAGGINTLFLLIVKSLF